MPRRGLAVVFAAAALASGLFGPAAAATKIESAPSSANAQNDLLDLVNGYRARNGLQAVAPNGALIAAATWMAGDMATRNYVGHVSSDGRSPTQRMASFGYPATSMFTGEDLGAGYDSANAILAGWQASAAHNAVLLNPNYNAVGIGLVYDASSTYKWYWTADFGGPGGTAKAVIPTPQPIAAKPPTADAAQPAPGRAVTAARGPAPQASEEIDANAAAESARAAWIERRAARRLAHLFAVLLRGGGI